MAAYDGNEVYEDHEYDEDLSRPVARLKSGLQIKELLQTHQTEFEIKPPEYEEEEGNEGYNAESCFDFNKVEELVNLDVVDVDLEEDGEDGSPFDKYHRKMKNLRPDGKLKKHLVKQGVGSLVPDNCLVYIRYQAYLEYQEVPFDSTQWQCSNKGDKPIAYDLARGELLVGLHEAILSMRKGEKSEFLVHHDLAFGKMGCPPRVPGEATVLFNVEVDRFVDCGEIHNNNDEISWEERNKYSHVIKIARGHYLLANDLFLKKNYASAANKYRQVINMVHNALLADEKEENNRNRFLVKLYTNACVAYHKMMNFKRVCLMASDAIRVDEGMVLRSPKLLYFWGYAKMMLADYDGARKHLSSALKLKPRDPEIQNAMRELGQRKQHSQVQEQVMMRKMFCFPSTKSSGVKITEVDEEDEKMRNSIRQQLQEFANDPSRDKITLISSLSPEEEKISLDVAKELGLYGRVIAGRMRTLEIKKPEE